MNVLGDLQPGLFLSVAGLDFPDQLLNTASAPLPIALTNIGLSAVGITGISTFGDFTQINNCGSGLPALASCAINVTFTPQVAGYRSARLTVQNTASGLLEIPLSGNGVIPAVRCRRRAQFSDRSCSIPRAPPPALTSSVWARPR